MARHAPRASRGLARISTWIIGGTACALAVLGAPLAATTSPAQGVPATARAAAVAAPARMIIRSTGLDSVLDVSKNGRYALGRIGNAVVVRDVIRKRTVRRLPTVVKGSPDSVYRYVSISDSGRYVAFSVTSLAGTGCDMPGVRDRKTNKVLRVATTATGAPLPTGWAGQGDWTFQDCDEEPAWRSHFTFSAPALSGNGRYVAFCANLLAADRLDLYVKDLRTRAIQRFDGACAELRSEFEVPQAPRISEDGRVIVLPGARSTGDEAGYALWSPASMLLDRATLVPNVGGADPQVTDDGSAIYSIGPMSCDGGFNPCSAGPKAPIRYDVAARAAAPVAAPDPGVGAMSRRGRYVVVVQAALPNPLWVLDRATGVATDLTPELVDGAVELNRQVAPVMSGDGKQVLVTDTTTGKVYRVRWM